MLLSATAAAAAPTATPAPQSQTIGLVLTHMRWALVETPGGKEECPDGLQPSPTQQFTALPAPRERLLKYGMEFTAFGPNGESSDNDPLKVVDPLPWKELKTTRGYGLNLDGTTDGRKTANTREHVKFINAAGQPVDNQLARAFGCVTGFRKGGYAYDYYANEIVTKPVNRHLIEVTGVDSEVDDPSVSVTIYKGRDGLVRGKEGDAFVANMSHRVDELFPEFILKTTGSIVGGVLRTDPIPLARMPIIYRHIAERHIRDMRLELTLTPDGAEGLLGGYEDIGRMWDYISKHIAEASRYSSAGLYRALLRNADAYPDAQGNYSAISAAYSVKAVRAMIIH